MHVLSYTREKIPAYIFFMFGTIIPFAQSTLLDGFNSTKSNFMGQKSYDEDWQYFLHAFLTYSFAMEDPPMNCTMLHL